MATGYHAARVANVSAGDTVVVMGDGAVGLCAIIAAKMWGAKKIISTSRHADRQALAKEFGATDNVAERGDEAVQRSWNSQMAPVPTLFLNVSVQNNQLILP